MNPTRLKIVTDHEVLQLVKEWRSGGETIVFTNGCFDILHLGHVDYLEKAKDLGNRLIVGVNADTSVTQLKGDQRPVNHEYARMRTIAALNFVDAVIRFAEKTPERIIRMLLPDVLVKGDDYEISNIAGADIVMQNGGKVETLALLEGYSTTAIIDKIKRLN